MALEKVEKWGAKFRQKAGAILVVTRSGRKVLKPVPTDAFTAYLLVLKGDRSVFFDLETNMISTGEQDLDDL